LKPALLGSLRFPRLWLVAGLMIAGLIAAASLAPPKNLPDFRLWDKIEHMLAYVLLAFWFGSVVIRRDYPALVIALLAFGGAIELLQEAMGFGRQGEWRDLLADAGGIGIGMLIAMTPAGRWPLWAEGLLPGRRSA
jgi:VanZ family protein